MLSPGPVLLGRIRCAMDEPAKAAAGDVDGSPGSPGAEVDTEIQRNWQQSWQGSWDQRQTFWIQRWTRRTLLCLLAIVAACLSGGLAYAFYHSASFQSQLDPDEASSISLVCFLIASNALAGGSAVLLWLTAPTQHLLLAARFLMLNWFGGLSSLFLIELRVPVLFLELMGLQYLAQDRLKSIWPALNSPQWGACLGQAFWLEFGLLLFSYSSLMILVAIVWFHSRISVDFFYVILRVLTLSHLLSTLLFLMWVLGVATTLCRVVLMLRRTLQMARKEENSTAVQSLLACRRHSFWQAIGFLASLATTFVLFKVAWSESVQSWGRAYHHGLEHLHIPTFSFAVTQCINSVVNVAGVILFSKVCNIFNLPGSVRPPALSWTPPTFGCQVCPRSRVRHNSDADTGTAKGSDWEAKTEELASRGISLSDLLEFYSTLGVCIMTSFQPDVHTTNDVVRLGIIPRTASARSSYADFVNNGTKVIPKKMVTHNWQNLFRDLLATVIADALGEHNFELIAGLLSDQEGLKFWTKLSGFKDVFRKPTGFVPFQSISTLQFVEETLTETSIQSQNYHIQYAVVTLPSSSTRTRHWMSMVRASNARWTNLMTWWHFWLEKIQISQRSLLWMPIWSYSRAPGVWPSWLKPIGWACCRTWCWGTLRLCWRGKTPCNASGWKIWKPVVLKMCTKFLQRSRIRRHSIRSCKTWFSMGK